MEAPIRAAIFYFVFVLVAISHSRSAQPHAERLVYSLGLSPAPTVVAAAPVNERNETTDSHALALLDDPHTATAGVDAIADHDSERWSLEAEARRQDCGLAEASQALARQDAGSTR